MLRKKVLAGFIAIAMIVSTIGMSKFVSATTSSDVYNDTTNWSSVAGTITQADNGINFSGSGSSGTLLESYYQTPFASIDGFHITLNLESLGAINGANHNSNFGIVFTDKQSQNYVWDTTTKGLFLYFQPCIEDSNKTTFVVNGLYRDSTLAAANINDSTLVIDKNEGSVDILLMKDTNSNWHLFINGVDKSADLSGIKAVLDAGNLNFGIVATENSATTNNYALRLSQINGVATGTKKDVDASEFVKSSRGNVSVSQAVENKDDGIHMTGSVSSSGSNFLFGYNTKYTEIDGFSTSMNVTMDGTSGVNGTPNFNFGLTSLGANTINSSRLDLWDFLNNPSAEARGLQIKFTKFAGYYTTSIFVLGSNNQFDIPADIISGANVLSDANGNITVSFVNTKNDSGASTWSVLSNGRLIIGGNQLINDELDALNASGAYPIYSAGYDSIGTLATANAEMIIPNIGGTVFGIIQDSNPVDTGNTITGNKQVTDSDFIYSTINPNASYLLTDDGLKVSAMNGPSGFNSLFTYGTQLDTSSLGVTLKLDTVFASLPSQPNHIDLILGNKQNANFTDEKSIYIRMITKGSTPQAGMTANIILNTTGSISGIVNSGTSLDVPVAADGLVVVKLIKVDGLYSFYFNGQKYPSAVLDSQISDLLDNQFGGKTYLESATGWDGVTNQANPTIYYLQAVNGLAFVKATDDSSSSTTSNSVDTGNTITGNKQVTDSDFIYSSINPNANYSITDDGLKVSAMNGPSGFNSLFTYGTQLDTSSLGVTLKLDTVFASLPSQPNHIDLILGNKQNANFTDEKSIYIRMITKGSTPQAGMTANIILNTTGSISGIVNSGTSLDVPVAADGLVVVKLIKVDGLYSFYFNGQKYPSAVLDSQISDLLDNQFGGKTYLESATGWDGVTNQVNPTIYYLQAVNGLAFVKASAITGNSDGNPETSDPRNLSVIFVLLVISGSMVIIKKKQKQI